MVHTVLDHKIETGLRSNKKSSYMFSENIYSITVTGEDGEYFTCEVMAESSAAACSVAEDLARDVMPDIAYITVNFMN